jgi:arachidonate 15-lipoxygenase
MWLTKICLPQNDKDLKCRNKNLEKKRNEYRYNYNIIPPLGIVDGLPKSEIPSLIWVFKLLQVAVALVKNALAARERTAWNFKKYFLPEIFRFKMLLRLLGLLFSGDPTNFFVAGGTYVAKFLKPGEGIDLGEYNDLFATIPVPNQDLDFQSDENFAIMRVAGWNPAVIERLDALPKNFPFTDKLFRNHPLFKNDSIASALKEKRLFMTDYKALEILQNGNQPNGEKYCYSPIALFAIDKSEKKLRPVAIQCGQDPKEFPIFTPQSSEWSWKMAKSVVNSADGNHHELVTHLSRTHLYLEPFVVATYRQLSARHPLFRLLVPHFQGTIFINYLAKAKLIAPGGGVDYLLSGTIASDAGVAVQSVLDLKFNESFFPVSLKKRKVDDPAFLEYYPYRDDGLLVWTAIENWVKSYLKVFYQHKEDITQDFELQLWAKEVSSLTGGRVKDFGEDGNGKLETLDYLVLAATQIIFTASAGHSSVNFPQRELMLYAPQVPLALYDEAPKANQNYTEKDWISMLPTLDIASLQLNLGYTLGAIYFTKLGEYPTFWFRNPVKEKTLDTYQEELKKVEQIIHSRNKTRYPYPFMLPSRLTQSINV